MSVEAVRWAIEEAPVPGHLFAVLACLAWKTDEHGRGAYPSLPTLAEWTGKTDRQVRADLRALEGAGLASQGDQSLARHIRADRRPTVWDVAMSGTTGSTRPEVSFPPEVHDRSSASVRDIARPEVHRHHGGKLTSANRSLIEKPTTSRKREEYDDAAFAEFWAAYPRKTAKRDAWKAWLAAVKRGAERGAVVKAALRFAEQRDGQDVRFTPHPATWLNHARYDDEAAPLVPVERDDESWFR